LCQASANVGSTRVAARNTASASASLVTRQLRHLTDQDLKDIGIPLGQRCREPMPRADTSASSRSNPCLLHLQPLGWSAGTPPGYLLFQEPAGMVIGPMTPSRRGHQGLTTLGWSAGTRWGSPFFQRHAFSLCPRRSKVVQLHLTPRSDTPRVVRPAAAGVPPFSKVVQLHLTPT
jgi:hypothetical protein